MSCTRASLIVLIEPHLYYLQNGGETFITLHILPHEINDLAYHTTHVPPLQTDQHTYVGIDA